MTWNSDKNVSDKASLLIKIMGGVFSAFIFMMIAYFIYGQFFTFSEGFFAGNCYEVTGTWTAIDDDGSLHAYHFPSEVDVGEDGVVKVYTILPFNLEDKTYMCFLTNRSMRVYVGNELRYAFDDHDNPIPGGYVKSHYITVELSREDSGKKIMVYRYDPTKDNSSFNAVLLGDKLGIILYLFKQDGAQAMAAFLLLVFSIMLIIIGIILRIIYNRRIPIIMLAIGTGMAALWFNFDSFLYQIIMGNYYVDGPMEYMLIMTLPFFFMIYLNYEQGRRYERIYAYVGMAEAANIIIETVQHFSGIKSYQDNLLNSGLCAGIVLLAMLSTILVDIYKKRVHEYLIVAIGYGFIFISGPVQIIVLLTLTDQHGAMLLVTGIFLLLIMATVNMILRLIYFEDEARSARQANELKSNFLANMSHEIRTPINAILGMNEMIQRESSEEHVRRYSANIGSAGNNLLGLINDILDFSKIESGKMEIINSDYRLSSLLTDVSHIIEERAGKKDLKFSIIVDKNTPDKLNGDPNRINQILLNILNNAVKYTEKGSVTLKVGFVSSTEEDNDKKVTLVFTAEDTGIGIREEDRNKLFKTFERLDTRRNRSIEGAGLGLAITNNLIQLMDGSLEVESTYGEGSVFKICIPQLMADMDVIGDFNPDHEAREEHTVYKVSFTAPEASILVVDDAPVNIMVVKGLLKDTKMNIDSASGGPECIAKCRVKKYDLVLLDHMMPNMDGIETLHILRNDKITECPIIALTANAIEGMKEMYLNEGFNDYLAKPTKPRDLEDMIRKYLPEDKIEK